LGLDVTAIFEAVGHSEQAFGSLESLRKLKLEPPRPPPAIDIALESLRKPSSRVIIWQQHADTTIRSIKLQYSNRAEVDVNNVIIYQKNMPCEDSMTAGDLKRREWKPVSKRRGMKKTERENSELSLWVVVKQDDPQSALATTLPPNNCSTIISHGSSDHDFAKDFDTENGIQILESAQLTASGPKLRPGKLPWTPEAAQNLFTAIKHGLVSTVLEELSAHRSIEEMQHIPELRHKNVLVAAFNDCDESDSTLIRIVSLLLQYGADPNSTEDVSGTKASALIQAIKKTTSADTAWFVAQLRC
jgi:hypothetical protein